MGRSANERVRRYKGLARDGRHIRAAAYAKNKSLGALVRSGCHDWTYNSLAGLKTAWWRPGNVGWPENV